MAGTYRDNSSSAEENRASGIVLLVVGFLGVVFVVLGMTKIIPLQFANPYLFYGIMSALFVLFIVMGFVSMVNAKRYEKKAKGEKGIKESLIEWALLNLKPEEIDERLDMSVIGSDEEKYFSRCEIISDILKKQFINLDPEMLDDLIDKIIYDKVYGDKAS